MLTRNDNETDASTVDVDDRPLIRRVYDRRPPLFVVCFLFAFFPALAWVAFLLLPVLAGLAVAGLALTLLRYAVTGNWRAFRYIASGLGLFAGGYLAARIGVFAGLPTVSGWSAAHAARAEAYTAAGENVRSLLADGLGLVAWLTAAGSLVVLVPVAVYGLIRPYRLRRLPVGAPLVAAALVGVVLGLTG